MSFPPRIKYGVNSSGNPDAVPVKTGNQNKKGLDARLRTSGMTEQRNWIPPYQVRGRLSQARNDKLYKTYKEKKCHADLGSASKEIKG